MTTNCVIYARSASSRQGEHATDPQVCDPQVRLCRAFAEVEGWNVVAICMDEGGSGVGTSRPGLLAALNLVRGGSAAVVLAQNVERLSRDLGQAADLHRRAAAAGARIVTIDDDRIDGVHTVTITAPSARTPRGSEEA